MLPEKIKLIATFLATNLEWRMFYLSNSNKLSVFFTQIQANFSYYVKSITTPAWIRSITQKGSFLPLPKNIFLSLYLTHCKGSEKGRKKAQARCYFGQSISVAILSGWIYFRPTSRNKYLEVRLHSGSVWLTSQGVRQKSPKKHESFLPGKSCV